MYRSVYKTVDCIAEVLHALQLTRHGLLIAKMNNQPSLPPCVPPLGGHSLTDDLRFEIVRDVLAEKFSIHLISGCHAESPFILQPTIIRNICIGAGMTTFGMLSMEGICGVRQLCSP